MKYSPKAVTFPILVALALAGGNVVAETTGAKKITAEQIRSGMPAEVAKDGQQFLNEEKATELRHRVSEDKAQGKAVRERKELQTQQEKKAKNQHQHQYKEQGGSQHQNQSGSFGSFGGKGSGGGSGSGGGGGRGR